MFSVGPIQENCFLFRRDGSDRALIVDPGEEADRLLAAIDELGVTLDGILLTHTHFDHVGAVAPIARATGAEVWVPEIEKPVLADINSYVPWPEFGPFESWDAEHTVTGGEKLELAGFEIDVLFTPGHSPGHVTFHVPDEAAIFSGDVLFQGSVGRTDLPGGDPRVLIESLEDARRDAARRDGRPSRAHGDHDARRRARDQSVPRPSSRADDGRQEAAGPAGHLRRAARRRAAPARAVPPRRSHARPLGYRPFETPVFEDTDLFARGVGESTDIVRKEMFTFEDQRRPLADAAPGGHRGRLPRLRRARHAQAAAAGEALVLGAVLPPRGAQAGRYRQFAQVGAEALGSDDPSLDAESILLLAELLEAAGRPRRAAAPGEPRHARRRAPSTSTSCAATCASTRASCPRTCAAGSTPTRCAPSTPTIPAPRP